MPVFTELQSIRNIFSKGYTPKWSKKNVCDSKIKDTALRKQIIEGTNDDKITGTFYGKEIGKY